MSKYGNHKEGKRKADDIANIAVISHETNLRLSDTPPNDYLAAIDDQDPALLDQHCITRDRKLWDIQHYPEFLEERRVLLAKAAQNLVDCLLEGQLP